MIFFLRKIFYFIKFHLVKNFFLTTEKSYTLNLDISRDYFISSDKGLFLIKKKKCIKILNLPCFGICFDNQKIYISSSDYFFTYLFEISFSFKESKIKSKLNLLFKKRIKYYGDRIHQIYLKNNILYFTSTYSDSLMNLNLNNLQTSIVYRNEKFSDSHINTVRCYNNDIYIMFNNFYDKQINQFISLVIKISPIKITKYFINIKGLHDIHYDNLNLYISCTFGDRDLTDGYLLVNGINKYKDFFSSQDYCIRGVAGSDNDEILIGSSNKGKHFKRFGGYSNLILKNKNNFSVQKFYSSQIYDILQCDNLRIKNLYNLETIDKFLLQLSYKKIDE